MIKNKWGEVEYLQDSKWCYITDSSFNELNKNKKLVEINRDSKYVYFKSTVGGVFKYRIKHYA